MPDFRDVRKKGFDKRAAVVDVLDWIDREVPLLPAESIPVVHASQRVLAADVSSTICVPDFDRAMMDGYAIVAESFHGASPHHPLPMQIVDTSMPGKPATATVDNDAVVQIMTGAPMPQGANAVLPFELVEQQGSQCFAIESVPAKKNVGYVGEDIRTGDTVAKRFQRLRPQDIGLLASVGVSDVSVFPQPRVRVIISGNEIVPTGSPRGVHQIFDSNGPMLTALIERDGGIPEVVFCKDDEDSLCDAISEPADVVLVSGGTSVGAEDLAPGIIQRLGDLVFHGIAMRPSSPTGVGKIGEQTFVFLLPGNPVSCLCAYDFFAGRAIRKLGGRDPAFPYLKSRLPLRRKISSVLGRMDYCRVKVVDQQIEPIAISGASVLSSLTKANGFVLIDPKSEGIDAGELADVYLFQAT